MERKIIEIGTVKNVSARYDTLYRSEGTKSIDVYIREKVISHQRKVIYIVTGKKKPVGRYAELRHVIISF